jgi:3-(3-hydroxy-phenyl)propionate hydroxylase
VERGVELVGLRQEATQVEAELAHADGRQELCRAAYVVGADGAHSAVRHLLGLSFAGQTLEQTFLLADLQVVSDLSDDEFHLFASADGLAAVIPMGAGRHRFIADNAAAATNGSGKPDTTGEAHAGFGAAMQETMRDDARMHEHAAGHAAVAGDAESKPSLALCRAVAERRAHHPLMLSELGWSSYFHINSRMVERLRMQRVFLAGDAAHVHSPAGAQGMNTGIQEALNLGWKLACIASGRAGDALLDTYQVERHPIERDVLRQTAFITQLAEAERGPLKLLRERVMPVLAAFGPLRDAARLMVSELAIQYRRSPLTLERVLDGGPRAGERAPDALVHVVDGPLGQAPGKGRLYDLHDPAFFSLFILVEMPSGDETAAALAAPKPDPELDRFSGTIEAALPGAVRIWRVTDAGDDESASLTSTYGRTRPAFYLVRPDGYIGARGRPASDTSALARHCETWFKTN